MTDVFWTIAQGVPLTLLIGAGSWVLCAFLGIVIAAATRAGSWPVRAVGDAYTMFMRGVPELVAIFIIYFGLHGFISLDPITSAIVALGLVEAPFAAEVYRASIATVDAGQRDVALSIGLRRRSTWLDVIAPQAARFATPPMLNIGIGMTKFAALASAIGVSEIVGQGETIIASGQVSRYTTVTIAMCVIYLIVTVPLSQGVRVLEHRMALR